MKLEKAFKEGLKNLFSALLLKSYQKKQENEKGYMGCGFPALVDIEIKLLPCKTLVMIMLPNN